MIPRFKPYLGKEELFALFKFNKNAVIEFEERFAEKFNVKIALSFSYGRSALWAFFKAMEIEGAEVIMPAYTCSVVAHAVVLSGNRPRFVDITLHDYNMNLDHVDAAISSNTRAIIATHIFGYPLDVDRLKEIVSQGELRFGHKIWIIQDCAHSFGAEWKGVSVCNEGDIAIFGLNISKIITSIFGGMLTTNNNEVAKKIRHFRDQNFHEKGLLKGLKRRIYLLAVFIAFKSTIYGLVKWLQEQTPLLDKLTKAYHLDDKIHFPPDYLDKMLAVEALVGLEQLKKYDRIISRRREIAKLYADVFSGYPGWVLPPIIDGATYSHYVVRVNDKEKVLADFAKMNVELGELIDYSIPQLPLYETVTDRSFPFSALCSTSVVNLPLHKKIEM
jgi:dTDP-4-amino-4,6-dideoxygalactose transaminase